jgi:Mg-chelatase subunit ChlD
VSAPLPSPLATTFRAVERRLALYVRALWNRPVELRATGNRVRIVDGAINLPPVFARAAAPNGVHLYRAAIAHAAAHLVYSTQRFPLRRLRPIQIALVGVIEDARVEQLALRDLPGLHRLWRPYHVATADRGVDAVSLMARLGRALIDPEYADGNPWVNKGRELFAAHAGALGDPEMSRTIGGLLGNDLGQMRIQFNAKTYVVEPAYRDDNLFLWDFGDSDTPAAEMDRAIWQMVDLEARDGAPVETSVVDAGDGVDVAEDVARYDEWDYVIGLARPGWCTVRERAARLGPAEHVAEISRRHRTIVERLTRLLGNSRAHRPVRLRAQLDGDRLDLDACVDAMVELRAGRTPSPRVHQRRGRRRDEFAVLLLLDLSRSAAERRPGTDATVLALARDATAIVAEAMIRLRDHFAIHGFHSNGRHDVAYYRFKNFDEPYDDVIRARLAGMTADFSTRIGAALRHAGSLLRARREDRRLILVLTDGQPHDVDIYDRRYLVLDAKRAVAELRRSGIRSFCVSLAQDADDHVPVVFGQRDYLVLDDVRGLPARLPWVYSRLSRG